jgi:hypothetical protein
MFAASKIGARSGADVRTLPGGCQDRGGRIAYTIFRSVKGVGAMGDICIGLYSVGFLIVYFTSLARLDNEKETSTSGPDLLVPFVFIGIWIGTLVLLSSVAMLIGGFSLLWLAFVGSLVVTGILFAALQIAIRRFDPAKEAQKMKRKPKRVLYDHLPY